MMCKKRQNLTVGKLKLKTCNLVISQVKKAKYLGIFIDRNLTFEDQCNSVIKKMVLGINL